MTNAAASATVGTADTQALAKLVATVGRVFRGHQQSVDLLVIAFLARGHVLIEDIPGVGKTTLARALAAASGGSFKRLQCTPDLMPADVTGVSIYQEHERVFKFHPGPIFCDVLLADELNRTPPRTQSALLEALSEGQVTVDGEPRSLPSTFFCIATQNPLDHVGTYPLPDSQRDRFLVSYKLGYPDADKELALLAHDGAENDLSRVTPVLDAATARALRARTQVIRVEDSVRRYILELVRATRGAKSLVQGASPRAGIGLQRACQARALLAGREFVIPDDVQALAVPCLSHRVTSRAGQATEPIIAHVVEGVAVPR
ncbi:MAG: MoxR family ATPase [Planctomycetes bacterium]|nr:MoxR family ATPase [Planctomycetota bacterium]